MKFKLTHLRPQEKGIRRALGDLEAEIMELMWSCGCASVRDIHAKLDSRGLAYTTVMTVMSRLSEKGLLDKEKNGKQYLYRPNLTRAEFEESVACSVLSGLAGSLGRSALASFVDSLDDEESLRELEELIKEKRNRR